MEVHSYSIREQFGTGVEPKETYRLGAARITNLPSVVYIFVPLEGFNHQINVNIKDNLCYTFEMFVSSIEGKTLSRPTWPCVGK